MAVDVTKNEKRCGKSNTLLIPRASSEKGGTSFSYRGPLLWNNLKPEIRAITNLGSFKRKLKDNKKQILSVSFKKGASQIIFKSADFLYFYSFYIITSNYKKWLKYYIDYERSKTKLGMVLYCIILDLVLELFT